MRTSSIVEKRNTRKIFLTGDFNICTNHASTNNFIGCMTTHCHFLYSLGLSFIHSLITSIYIAPLQVGLLRGAYDYPYHYYFN